MRKIIVTIILISFYKMTLFSQKSDLLIFDNFTQKKIYLPNEFKSMQKKIFDGERILLDYVNMKNLEGKLQVPKGVFDILCEQDLINLWSLFESSGANPYSKNRKKFIEQRKKELILYSFGKLTLSENYESYLILVVNSERDSYIVNRSLYLLNVTNNKLNSLTRLAYYICFDGTCENLFTQFSAKRIFFLKRKEICSDNIIPDEIKSKKEEIHARFFYDKNGYLKLLKKWVPVNRKN